MKRFVASAVFAAVFSMFGTLIGAACMHGDINWLWAGGVLGSFLGTWYGGDLLWR